MTVRVNVTRARVFSIRIANPDVRIHVPCVLRATMHGRVLWPDVLVVPQCTISRGARTITAACGRPCVDVGCCVAV